MPCITVLQYYHRSYNYIMIDDDDDDDDDDDEPQEIHFFLTGQDKCIGQNGYS